MQTYKAQFIYAFSVLAVINVVVCDVSLKNYAVKTIYLSENLLNTSCFIMILQLRHISAATDLR